MTVDFVIKRNKVNTSAAVDIFIVALLFLRGLNINDNHKHSFYMGRPRRSSPYHTSQAAKMTTDSSILSLNADGPKSE